MHLAPFHAAEQHNKVQNNDTAERKRLSEASVLYEQHRAVPYHGTSGVT